MSITKETEIDWGYLAKQVSHKRCIPFISNRVSNRYLFPDRDIVQAWAEQIGYPFADRSNLALVAQYLSVLTSEGKAQSDYLDFLKRELLADAKANGLNAASPFFDTLEAELDELTPTELAHDLGFGRFDVEPDNPWWLLAKLSLPIYLTTSFHRLMEGALTLYGRKPQSALYCWSEELESQIPLEFLADPKVRPTEDEPLVYHLYGSDGLPNSLVLNEDNFFDFIEHITYDLDHPDEENTTGLPAVISRSLSSSAYSILLLGYNLYDWDFRVAFRSAIKRLTKRRRELSLFVQFEPGSDDSRDEGVIARIHTYLDAYAQIHNFKIYPGDVCSFLVELTRAMGR
ncbi:MAG: hypothetical protein DCC55_28930 [Chloroflexi bacterium]|nr:MAG: hypothetical protein DCC55_28930 [Chloroflexota bacterium]